MSLVSLCEDCGARVVMAGGMGFDAPQKGLLEELAPGRPQMPDSLRLVIFGRKKAQVLPRNVRGLYLHYHRCSRPRPLQEDHG